MIKIICVAYERPVPMRMLIDCFLVQTNPNWELNIIYDGKAPQSILDIVALYSDPRVKFFESDERNQCYGHPNRKMMLENMQGNPGDFVLMTNDDNYYVPVFVEYMLIACKPNIGFVYCDTVHSHFRYDTHKPKIKENHIDMGCFIVRFDVAKRVGFNHLCFTADGKYAEECFGYCLTHRLISSYIPKSLFVHN
jgi:hypothetical protein